jgi:hypothetical protein
MFRFNALLKSAGILAVVGLAACGGGGGGGGGSVAPPTTTIANTSSPFFLPVKSGNRWVFSTGGTFVDTGRGTISCACTINGQVAERIDLNDPTGAYSGTYIFSKSTSGSSTIDTLLGSSTDHGATVSLLTDGLGHYGIPVNDSNAFAGENWANAGGTSRITGVNGTQAYGSAVIQSINTDTLTASTTSLTWGFARGVGFTSVSANGQTTTLTSFSIDATGSQAFDRSSASVRVMAVTGVSAPEQAASLARALF